MAPAPLANASQRSQNTQKPGNDMRGGRAGAAGSLQLKVDEGRSGSHGMKGIAAGVFLA